MSFQQMISDLPLTETEPSNFKFPLQQIRVPGPNEARPLNVIAPEFSQVAIVNLLSIMPTYPNPIRIDPTGKFRANTEPDNLFIFKFREAMIMGCITPTHPK